MTADPRTRRLQAEALLCPTPLEHLDPAGEEARVQRLHATLGGDLTAQEQTLLNKAREHATSAQVGGGGTPAGSGQTPTPPMRHLKHPLGGGEEPVPEVQAAREAWAGFVQGLAPVDSAEAWNTLYLKFAKEKCSHKIPHNPALPDHSVFAHRTLAAALVGARAGGEAALLLVQVGPVQPFIEASRRTRDLWAGSFLMSFMAAQVVEEIMKALGPEALLSPRIDALPLLRQRVFGEEVKPEELLQPALPAKVLALVPAAQAQTLGEGCREAIAKVWDGLAKATRNEVGKKYNQIGWDHGFKPQLALYLERLYTIQPWPDDLEAVQSYLREVQPLPTERPEERDLGATFGRQSGALWALHSAAKRAVVPDAHTGDHRPKCTQCGQREQLGPEHPGDQLRFWDALRAGDSLEIKRGEALCAVCLVKRLGVVPYLAEQLGVEETPIRAYPSIPSVACSPMRRRMLQAQPGEPALGAEEAGKAEEAQRAVQSWLEAIRKVSACTGIPTPAGNGLPGLGALGREGSDKTSWTLLDIDGAWLDEDAYEPERSWKEQTGRSPADKDYRAFAKALADAKGPWARVQRALGRPSHYVAALLLDGDGLSQWLNGTHRRTPTYGEVQGTDNRTPRPVFPALQGEVSARLSRLAAGKIAGIIHRHLGRLVYCGGDDVLALLPLETALCCADEVAQKIQSPDSLGSRVTVSAGLAIQHQREPLARLIRGAREAEKVAKGAKDRLVVRVTPRSGDVLELELPWTFTPAAVGSPPGQGATQTDAKRSIDALYGLLLLDDEEEGSPLNLKLGYTLRQDLHELGLLTPCKLRAHPHPTGETEVLRNIIRTRLISLAGGDRRGQRERVCSRLELPLTLLEAPGHLETVVQNVVNLLLVARFLRRERLEDL